MRVFSLISIVLHLSFSLCAQNYVPFPTNNAVWNISTYDGTGGGVQRSNYQYALSNDTLIEGKIWKQLLKKGGSTCYNAVCIYQNYSVLTGFIREDNKKIFFKTVTDSAVFTLYDFNNLQLGDTLSKRNLWGKQAPTHNEFVVAIDSIYLGQVWRKHYQIGGGIGRLYIIEGIGSTKGLIPSYYEFEQGVQTDCVRVGQETIFGNGLCNVLNSVGDVLAEKVSISPNPVNNVLIIKGLKGYFSSNITILNTFGHVVKTIDMGDNYPQIAVNDLANGLYFCQIRGRDKAVLSLKFVVAH